MERMENIRHILSHNLRKRRDELGWIQDDLAEKSGLSLGYVKNIERGKQWPSPESFEALGKGLGISIDDLLRDTTAKKVPLRIKDVVSKMISIPDEIYDLAEELGDNKDSVWDDVIETLLIAIEDKKLNKNA